MADEAKNQEHPPSTEEVTSPPNNEEAATIPTTDSTRSLDQVEPHTEEASIEKPVEKVEKSKLTFLSRLKKFSEKQTEVETGSPFDSNSDGYVSAREAINALDKEIQVNAPSEDEVAAQVRDQLEQQAEYYVIRVRKSVFMLAAGTLLLLVWLVILMGYWQKNQMPNWLNFVPGMQSNIQTTPAPEEVVAIQPSPSPTKIRLKTMENDLRAEKITTILRDNGYTSVDVETVTEIVEPGVLIAVKQNDTALLARLLTLLQKDHQATSSATTLSADSDFASVIWLGKN